MADRAFLERLSRELTESGRVVEAGWVALRLRCIPLNAPPIQLTEMRLAYLAGAQHIFATINAIMDPGTEPTEGDMRRMDMIHKELQTAVAELQRWTQETTSH